MTQRTLSLTQNNNLPKRCPSKGSFRFNQFRYKKTRKANYDFGQNNTWKQILRGKLLRHKISQGETQVFRTGILKQVDSNEEVENLWTTISCVQLEKFEF